MGVVRLRLEKGRGKRLRVVVFLEGTWSLDRVGWEQQAKSLCCSYVDRAGVSVVGWCG